MAGLSVLEGAERKLGPLFRLAIRSGASDAVGLHIRRGEPINGRDSAGLTPLMLAAVHGQLDVGIRLLDTGADPSLLSPDGRTAGELAAELGHVTLAELLASRTGSLSLAIAEQGSTCEMPALEDEEPEPANLSTTAPLSVVVANLLPAKPVSLSEHSKAGEGESGWDAADESLEALNGWVADEAVVAPHHDAECVSSALKAQHVMSTHRRVNNEMDWSDVELDLPEVRLQASAISLGEMPAVEELIVKGLDAGFVGTDELWHALDADCGWQIERAHLVLQRVLDDLAILSGPWKAMGHAGVSAEPEALSDAIDALRADMPEPAESSVAYAAEVRKGDLIKREDEERIGRHMDSALGTLTRALTSIPDAQWQQAFPSSAPASAPADEGADELETSPDDTPDGTQDEDALEAGNRIDFGTYVALVRDGMAEYGREAMVPRPRAAELSRLLALAPEMTADVGQAVVGSIAAYEKARDHLISANLRLAMSVAYGHRNRELPLEDLIQEANLGLMRAAEKFDFRRGFKFSTYATHWIRQSVTRGLADTGRLIRIPVHMVEKINVVNRARRNLEARREGQACIDEIAEQASLSPEEVRRIVRLDRKVISLEECVEADAVGTQEPFDIADPEADPYFIASRQSLSRLVERMLADCKEKERDVVVLRFGLSGLDSMTLEEVGQKLDVTRERIRQIESKALTRFRQASRRDQLLPFGGAASLADY